MLRLSTPSLRFFLGGRPSALRHGSQTHQRHPRAPPRTVDICLRSFDLSLVLRLRLDLLRDHHHSDRRPRDCRHPRDPLCPDDRRRCDDRHPVVRRVCRDRVHRVRVRRARVRRARVLHYLEDVRRPPDGAQRVLDAPPTLLEL